MSRAGGRSLFRCEALWLGDGGADMPQEKEIKKKNDHLEDNGDLKDVFVANLFVNGCGLHAV